MLNLPEWAHPDLWLDDDHAVQFYSRHGETEICGANIWHRPGPNKPAPLTTPGWCLGAIEWDKPTGWTLVSRDPLTVSPSILCGCGEHGFIREGRWVPA